MREGKYSLLTDEWIVEPYTIDLDFNPDEFYRERKRVIEELVKEFDIKIGNISRLVQDVDYLRETIEQAPVVVKRKWKKWLDKKIEDLEKEIDSFYEKIDEVIQARHELKERYGADVEENLLFKFLQRYQYIRLAKELKKIMGKGFESEEEIMEIKDVLSKYPFKKVSQLEDVDEPVDVERPVFTPPPPAKDPEVEELRRMLEPEARPPREELRFREEPIMTKPERELAELVEAPRLWKRLEPIDRQLFYALEKARVDAISKGDLMELRRIHEQEERIIEKYKKEVVKSDELSGFSFATRLIEAHYKIQRDKNPVAFKVFDELSKEIYRLGFMIHSASVVEIETDEWVDVNKGEVEFVIDVSSPLGQLSKRSIIVKGILKDDGEVIIHPFFYDFLGNKYPLDAPTLNKFLGVVKEKLNDEWLERLTPKEQIDEIDILKSDKLYILSSVREKFAEKYREINCVDKVLLLNDVVYDENEDCLKVIYSIYPCSSVREMSKFSRAEPSFPKKIVCDNVELMRDKVKRLKDKIIVVYK